VSGVASVSGVAYHPPTDDEIAAELDAVPDAVWRELFAIADALTDVDRQTGMGGGQEISPGVTQMPYPVYSAAINRIRKLLPTAEFNYRKWSTGNPLVPEGHGLDAAPVADAVRLATCYVHGERFDEGLIGIAIRSGALDAIIARLRVWVETRR
jgi:O-acetyl-ADP-ribose deacetylase